MQNIVKVEVNGGTLEVSLPFALKNSFKETFKSAKWNPNIKKWTINTASQKRLDQWIELVNTSYDADADAKADALEMTFQELEKVSQSIIAANYELKQKTETLNNVIEDRESLVVERIKLDGLKKNISSISSQIDEQNAAVTDEKSKIEAMIDGIVPIAVMQQKAREMDKWHKIKSQMAHGKFDECQNQLLEYYELFEAAGIKYHALLHLVNANFNRHDRDGLHAMPNGAWHKFTQI